MRVSAAVVRFQCARLVRPADDRCYYVLDQNRLPQLKAGDQVFLYDDDLVEGVMGVDGELIEDRGTLIARPLSDSFYYGLKFL